ncbi:transposase [Cribrihabitans neustonicus]|uniref:transposase n=1 Tax=Cribrihabitans neustonicus TaxID=1429085 RepID=UPI003B5C37B1
MFSIVGREGPDFRWFARLGIDDQVWEPAVFTKIRDWLLAAGIPHGTWPDIPPR